MDGVHDLDFANAAHSVEQHELDSAAGKIRSELQALGLAEAAE
jgi:hypothetical protein